jgi:hypothetical protein
MERFRTKGLAELLETLRQLPPEIVSKSGGPVRSAARKAGVVIQQEAILNIDRLAADGATNESTGLLKKSLIVSRRKPRNFKGEKYWIRVKRRAKGTAEGQAPSTYGAVLEFGDERIEAKSWLRTAAETKRQEAISTFVEEMTRGTARAVRKAAKRMKKA